MGYSTLLGLFDKCLGTPNGKCGICLGADGWYTAIVLDIPAGKWGMSPGGCLQVVPLCRQDYSDHGCRYLKRVSLPDVSTLTSVIFLLSQNESWLTDSHFSWQKGLHYVLYTLCSLNRTNVILLVLLSTILCEKQKKYLHVLKAALFHHSLTSSQMQFFLSGAFSQHFSQHQAGQGRGVCEYVG